MNGLAVNTAYWPNGGLVPDCDPREGLLSHLHVFVAQRQYLLAMKCAAMRLGEEFHDVDDVRYLLRFLNVTTVADAMHIVTQYFDEARLSPKTWLVLAELLPE